MWIRGPYVRTLTAAANTIVAARLKKRATLLVATEQDFREQFAIDCRTRCEVIGISPKEKTCSSRTNVSRRGDY